MSELSDTICSVLITGNYQPTGNIFLKKMEFFNGKTAVVTGAAQGIGNGIAKALLQHRAHVNAVDKDEETLTRLKKEFPEVQTVVLDLSDWDKTRSTFESFEGVDLLVNNAALATEAPFLESSKADIDMLLDTNFKAVLNTMRVIGKSMRDRGNGGAIVNISSILSGKLDLPGRSVYGATKAAVDKLTRAAAFELGKYKIRVNSIQPTTTKTQFALAELSDPERSSNILSRTALGRFNDIEDVVGPVLFLLNDELSGMVHGESLIVDGGLR